MQKFKRQVSFYLALIMLLGSVLPGPVVVEANVPIAPFAAGTNFPHWNGTAFEKLVDLQHRSSILQTNIFGNVVYAANQPTARTRNTLLMSWPIAPGAERLYVLRHFAPISPDNDTGRRIEMLVHSDFQGYPIAGATLTVNIDVLSRIGTNNWRSIFDPIHGPLAANFDVQVGLDGVMPLWETVNADFFSDSPARNRGFIGTVAPLVGANTVLNNRLRWADPPGGFATAGGPITPYHDDFLDPTVLNFDLRPSEDPADPPGTLIRPPLNDDHYRYMTPSFQVSGPRDGNPQNGGATIRIGSGPSAILISFMWDGTNFFVFYENLHDGFIYEFELEMYTVDTPLHMMDYYRTNVANLPWAGARGYLPGGSHRLLHLPGLSGFRSLPYAHKFVGAGAGVGGMGWVRHTHRQFLPYFGDPATPIPTVMIPPPPPAPNDPWGPWIGGGPTTIGALYSIMPLQQNDSDVISPANQPTALFPGLILSLHMPVMFDEMTGAFDDWSNLATRGNPSPITEILSIRMTLYRGTEDAANITFMIEDGAIALVPGGANVETVRVVERGGRHYIMADITMLPPSMLFDRVEIDILHGRAWNNRNGSSFYARHADTAFQAENFDISEGQNIFTFLDFETHVSEWGIREVRVRETYALAGPLEGPVAQYRFRFTHPFTHLVPPLYPPFTHEIDDGGTVPYRPGDSIWLTLSIDETSVPTVRSIMMFEFSRTGMLVSEHTVWGNIWSQQVIYTPDPITPNIPPLIGFEVERLEFRAHPPDFDDDPPTIDFSTALLYFRLNWNMGYAQQFINMLNHAGVDYIHIDYLIRASEIPDDADLFVDYWDFIGARATVGRAANGGVYVVWSIHRILPDGSFGPELDDPENDNLWFMSGENLIGSHAAGITGTTTLFSNLRLGTSVLHRGVNVADFDFFRFPAIYSFYVRGVEWRCENNELRGVRPVDFRTLSESLTLNDLERPVIPPPVDLIVSAVVTPEGSNRPVTSPAALDVRYTIPMNLIRDMLNTFFGPGSSALVTTNLYIGMNEFELARDFFNFPPGIEQLAPEDRPAFVDLHLDFINNSTNGLIHLNETHRELLRRGGVIRINDIPIIETQRHLGQAIDPHFRDYPNDMRLPHPADLPFNVLAASNALPPHLMLLTVQGLDENASYFMFAELNLSVYMTTTPAGVGVVPGDLRRIEVPGVGQTSALTAIDGATTLGIVLPPRPEDLEPTTPTGFTAEEDPPMSTNVLLGWNRVDAPEGTRVVYELIRGYRRFTGADMQNRSLNIFPFVDGFLPDEYIVWRIDGNQLLVREAGTNNFVPADPSQFLLLYPPFEGDRFQMRDFTTGPNQIYFYYIRAVFYVEDDDGEERLTAVSYWAEATVTTSTISPLTDLMDEGGHDRIGFDVFTMRLVSFGHVDMQGIIAGAREIPPIFRLEYQLSMGEGIWTPPQTMRVAGLEAHPNPGRYYYMVTGLMPGTYYEMRVRVVHIGDGIEDVSLWSNIIVFLTADDDDLFQIDRDTGNWIEHLRRQLYERLDRPYWIAQDTPTNSIIVYRGAPHDVFRGLVQGTAGGAIPLRNTDAPNVTYFMPLSIMQYAESQRMGFSTRFSDLEFMMPASFLNSNHNQTWLDMMRILNTTAAYTDMFIRLDFELRQFTYIDGIPAASRQASFSITAQTTNRNISSIASWDHNILLQAQSIVAQRIQDPVLRQSIVQLLVNEATNEELWLLIDQLVDSVYAHIASMVLSYLRTTENGILTTTTRDFTNFDLPVHITLLGADPEFSVNAFILHVSGWIREQHFQMANGPTISVRAPGTFAFTGRLIIIADLQELPRGGAVIAIVATFGLDDLFGYDVNLHQNANRHMIVGSVARIAGAPVNADPIAWSAANLNVQMTNRNANSLLQTQEAIALVMALYERRTNTSVAQIVIRDTHATAGMNLDPRYRQAVNAAFEIGIVTNRNINPQGSITIGEFLDMLSQFNQRVRM